MNHQQPRSLYSGPCREERLQRALLLSEIRDFLFRDQAVLSSIVENDSTHPTELLIQGELRNVVDRVAAVLLQPCQCRAAVAGA